MYNLQAESKEQQNCTQTILNNNAVKMNRTLGKFQEKNGRFLLNFVHN